jgi:hypothetical protein
MNDRTFEDKKSTLENFMVHVSHPSISYNDFLVHFTISNYMVLFYTSSVIKVLLLIKNKYFISNANGSL